MGFVTYKNLECRRRRLDVYHKIVLQSLSKSRRQVASDPKGRQLLESSQAESVGYEIRLTIGLDVVYRLR